MYDEQDSRNLMKKTLKRSLLLFNKLHADKSFFSLHIMSETEREREEKNNEIDT